MSQRVDPGVAWQHSPDEGRDRDADARDEAGDRDAAINAALDLDELIELMQRTNWESVPTISVLEASVLTQRLIEAREAIDA